MLKTCLRKTVVGLTTLRTRRLSGTYQNVAEETRVQYRQGKLNRSFEASISFYNLL